MKLVNNIITMFALQQEQIALLLENSVAVFKLDDQTLHRLVEPLLRAVPELRDANAAYNQLHKPVPTTCWDKPGCPTPQFVLGGFGGTGEPSLFHAPSIRKIRAAAYATMFPQFAEAFPDRKLEVLFDRFGIRRNGLKVDKEEWHRDVATQIKDGDIIYGGWINLDPPMQADNKTKTKPQIFTCVENSLQYPKEPLPVLTPEQHMRALKAALNEYVVADLKDMVVASGQTVPKGILKPELVAMLIGPYDDQLDELISNKQKVAKKTKKKDGDGFSIFTKQQGIELEKHGREFSIPPGSMIVFNQRIAHCISNATMNFTSFRLYMGWRITHHDTPLYNKNTVITRQSVPQLPSGQQAPMYAKIHKLNWKTTLLEPFSQTFKPELMDTDVEMDTCVRRNCHSLQWLQDRGACNMYAPYTARERAMFYPHRLLDGPAAGPPGLAADEPVDASDESADSDGSPAPPAKKGRPVAERGTALRKVGASGGGRLRAKARQETSSEDEDEFSSTDEDADSASSSSDTASAVASDESADSDGSSPSQKRKYAGRSKGRAADYSPLPPRKYAGRSKGRAADYSPLPRRESAAMSTGRAAGLDQSPEWMYANEGSRKTGGAGRAAAGLSEKGRMEPERRLDVGAGDSSSSRETGGAGNTAANAGGLSEKGDASSEDDVVYGTPRIHKHSAVQRWYWSISIVLQDGFFLTDDRTVATNEMDDGEYRRICSAFPVTSTVAFCVIEGGSKLNMGMCLDVKASRLDYMLCIADNRMHYTWPRMSSSMVEYTNAPLGGVHDVSCALDGSTLIFYVNNEETRRFDNVAMGHWYAFAEFAAAHRVQGTPPTVAGESNASVNLAEAATVVSIGIDEAAANAAKDDYNLRYIYSPLRHFFFSLTHLI